MERVAESAFAPLLIVISALFLFANNAVIAKPIASFVFVKKSTVKTAPTKHCSENIQTDLSGKYSGKVEYPSAGLSGAVDLEIGPQQQVDQFRFNPFSLKTKGPSAIEVTGKLIVVTSCGYTTIAMALDNRVLEMPSQKQPSAILSLRACKTGKSFRLSNATMTTGQRSFSFTSDDAPTNDLGKWGRCG